jgi:hypothetical protein
VAIVSVASEIGCPAEETARLAASLLSFHLLTEFELSEALDAEFGPIDIPDAAWSAAVQATLCRMAATHHLLLAFPGCEYLFQGFQGILRIHLTASDARKTGNYMLEHQLDRPLARRRLTAATRKRQAQITARFPAPMSEPDLTIHTTDWSAEQSAHLIESAARCRHLPEQGYLAGAPLKQFEFDLRLTLASHGIAPNGKAGVKSKMFSHPSEELFANLLDFYRIAWVYEPRSFPLQWNESGAVSEAFTPDFYLPESDLYVELTTMKQSLVTRKNRKLRKLRKLYPEVKIKLFYERDFERIASRYGLRKAS